MKHIWQSVKTVDSPLAELDNGPVIVLVDDRGTDDDVLGWAAAEAAARGSELRIVHAFRWPLLLDPFGNATVNLAARGAAEEVVTDAVARAHEIAPSLTVSAHVFPGRRAKALVTAARRAGERGLVVLGHGERALTRTIVRRTMASVATVGLSGSHAVGPSAGRVVVDDSPQALGFAFRSARRRGTGLTVVQIGRAGNDLRNWQTAYPEVDVRRHVASGPLDSAILAESAAAALTVLGRGPTYDVLRLARGPVVMI